MASFWKYASYSVLFSHVVLIIFFSLMPILVPLGAWQQWHWTEATSFRLTHMVVLSFLAVEAIFRIPCPLTVADNFCRKRAGMPLYLHGFFDYWVAYLLKIAFKNWMFDLTLALIFVSSLTEFLLFMLR